MQLVGETPSEELCSTACGSLCVDRAIGVCSAGKPKARVLATVRSFAVSSRNM